MNSMPTEHKKVGPIIAILIIVLILVIGALYLFASSINREQAPVDNSMANTNGAPAESVEPQTVAPVTNTSDEIEAIESDLNSSTNGLDNSNY
jgi:flagellar basal body-associated protein FliL